MSLTVFIKYVLDGKPQSVEIGVNQKITVGRSSKADVKVNDDSLSSVHCTFCLESDRLIVKDGESKNGSYLNNIRFEKAQMFIGDEVRIGHTKFSLDSSKMDEFSKSQLSFPDSNKNRQIQNLKVDFTGARIQNQLTSVKNNNIMSPRPPSAFQKKEIELRKVAKSHIRVTKEQIKAQHKMRSSFAALFDIILVFTVISIPITALNYFIAIGGIEMPGLSIGSQLLEEQRGTFVIVGEIVLMILFFFFNFKKPKFSFGEKLAGIQRKYIKQ